MRHRTLFMMRITHNANLLLFCSYMSWGVLGHIRRWRKKKEEECKLCSCNQCISSLAAVKGVTAWNIWCTPTHMLAAQRGFCCCIWSVVYSHWVVTHQASHAEWRYQPLSLKAALLIPISKCSLNLTIRALNKARTERQQQQQLDTYSTYKGVKIETFKLDTNLLRIRVSLYVHNSLLEDNDDTRVICL